MYRVGDSVPSKGRLAVRYLVLFLCIIVLLSGSLFLNVMLGLYWSTVNFPLEVITIFAIHIAGMSALGWFVAWLEHKAMPRNRTLIPQAVGAALWFVFYFWQWHLNWPYLRRHEVVEATGRWLNLGTPVFTTGQLLGCLRTPFIAFVLFLGVGVYWWRRRRFKKKAT